MTRAGRSSTAMMALLFSAFVSARQVQTASSDPRLSEYEGTYDYRDAATLFIVAVHGGLVAILNEAKYPLRGTGPDAFVNPSGDAIPFIRDAQGGVTAFQEHGDTFRRRSRDVPTDVRQLLEARPRIPDGTLPVYRYQPPTSRDDGIQTGSVGPGTITAPVAERLVNGVVSGAYPDVRSILVYQHGALRLEEYFYGYGIDRPHQMRSLTKSVVSLAAGAAVDRGLLRADEPVLPRLGYAELANPDPRKAKITLIDLLSHRSGLACDDHDGSSPGNETKLYETADWVKAFLDLPVRSDPGTSAYYCSGGIFATGRIVERAAGKPLPEFVDETIFQPLGIRRADWKWNFTLDRSQRNEFGQIYLRPRDMLKLGLLIKQQGLWAGKRVVSSSWIDQAVSTQSRVDNSDYGLGIWHRWYSVQTSTGERRVDTIMLSGNGGQKVFLVPSLDLIVVFTGASFNRESPQNEMMAGVLLPALIESAGSVERSPERHGNYAKGAALIGWGQSSTSKSGATVSVVQYDDNTDEGNPGVLSVQTERGLSQRRIDFAVGIEALWSPDGSRFALTGSAGGANGSYEAVVVTPTNSGLDWFDVTPLVYEKFGHPAKCGWQEVPNVAAITWLSKSQILVAAEIIAHSNCDSFGTFVAYQVDVESHRVLRRHDQLETKAEWGSALGAELKKAPDYCVRDPKQCYVSANHPELFPGFQR